MHKSNNNKPYKQAKITDFLKKSVDNKSIITNVDNKSNIAIESAKLISHGIHAKLNNSEIEKNLNNLIITNKKSDMDMDVETNEHIDIKSTESDEKNSYESDIDENKQIASKHHIGAKINLKRKKTARGLGVNTKKYTTNEKLCNTVENKWKMNLTFVDNIIEFEIEDKKHKLPRWKCKCCKKPYVEIINNSNSSDIHTHIKSESHKTNMVTYKIAVKEVYKNTLERLKLEKINKLINDQYNMI